MGNRAASGRRWKVGELASATGLTVRTLHHYEQVGLLSPAQRTEGNQRLYDEDDVVRLYRIRALRDLGLSLADIGPSLEEEGGLGDVLRAHLVRVEAELERLGQLRVLLARACVQAERMPDPEDVLAAIEAMTRVMRRAETRRRESRVPAEAQAAWRVLGEELRACREAGDAPSSPAALSVTRSIQARLLDFAGGDPAILEALATLRRLDPPDGLAGWDPDLFRYLDRALSALKEVEDETC